MLFVFYMPLTSWEVSINYLWIKIIDRCKERERLICLLET